MLNEFRTFIARGNVIDLAVGIVVGAAFSTVVRSFVDDILMPPIGSLMGGADFTDLFISLSGERYESLAEATAAGAATINYGLFLNNLVSFVIVAVTVFLLVRSYNRLRVLEAEAPPAPSEQECPFCLMRVPLNASRCAHCTSEIRPGTVGI